MAHNEVAELGDSLAGLPSLQELRIGHNELTRCTLGSDTRAGRPVCLPTHQFSTVPSQSGSVRGMTDVCLWQAQPTNARMLAMWTWTAAEWSYLLCSSMAVAQ